MPRADKRYMPQERKEQPSASSLMPCSLGFFCRSSEPVLGTNPLAYGIPRPSGPSLLVDQASSQTAYVNIRSAAAQQRSIPDGWAIDETGRGTTDPSAALRGALLPFGGYKGANIALLVEMLAVLSGANWSSCLLYTSPSPRD